MLDLLSLCASLGLFTPEANGFPTWAFLDVLLPSESWFWEQLGKGLLCGFADIGQGSLPRLPARCPPCFS